MTDEQQKAVIAIDGGGTKTTALLVGMDGTVLAERKAGPSNLLDVGVPRAAQLMFDLVSAVAEKGGLKDSAIAHVIIGVAGAGRESVRSELISALSSVASKNKFSITRITVETDARIALEAAHPRRPVIALIAGTGSIALYRADDGQIHRAGGWGSLLGDEGSAFAIARDGCAAVLRHIDGRGEKTILRQAMLTHFGIGEPQDVLIALSQEKTRLASFAVKVIEAVTERDRVARNILQKHAAELADLVGVLAMKVPPKFKLPVCPMGGLLEGDNEYSRIVREKLKSTLPQISVQKPKFPPVFGAAILGLNAFR